MHEIILACALALPSAGHALADALAKADDLPIQARRNMPVVLFFTLAGCPYCERARSQYMRPLARSSGWSDRAVILEVPIESTLRGFDGKSVSGRTLAQGYGIRAYPTVIFVDHAGRLLADPLAGYTVPDFYGAYLDDRLETALARLHKP